MDATTLLPCPFCATAARVFTKNGLTFYAECERSYCAVIGPERCARDAADVWNKRAEGQP